MVMYLMIAWVWFIIYDCCWSPFHLKKIQKTCQLFICLYPGQSKGFPEAETKVVKHKKRVADNILSFIIIFFQRQREINEQ